MHKITVTKKEVALPKIERGQIYIWGESGTPYKVIATSFGQYLLINMATGDRWGEKPVDINYVVPRRLCVGWLRNRT